MSGESNFAGYIGSIGDDAFGNQLKESAERDGVTTYYHVTREVPTGTCAVLVHEAERSLVANISASEKYDKAAHFDTPEIQHIIKGAKIFYSASFFLTHTGGFSTMKAMGTHAAESHGKQIYTMNLSAPFLCQFFKTQMLEILPFADFVFGNESEAQAFASSNGFPENIEIAEIALRIANFPKASGTHQRTVVITQGSIATVIATGGKIVAVPVDPLPASSIVDTNGAGDAFVGGFLAYLAKGASLADCTQAGHWAAGHVIQRSGAKFDIHAKYVPK
jgi:adenosine kinase